MFTTSLPPTSSPAAPAAASSSPPASAIGNPFSRGSSLDIEEGRVEIESTAVILFQSTKIVE